MVSPLVTSVLIVEDDLYLAKTLQSHLQSKHVSTHLATTLAAARRNMAQFKYEVMILDRSLPDGDGLDLRSELPITVRCLVMSRLTGLEARLSGWRQGVDDYLEKPFCLEEWWWRVKRLLETEKHPQPTYYQLAETTFYPALGQLRSAHKTAQLRRKETAILQLLCQRQGHLVTRDELIDRLWPTESAGPAYSTIDVYMRRLRLSLGETGNYLHTVRGFGYILKTPTTPTPQVTPGAVEP